MEPEKKEPTTDTNTVPTEEHSHIAPEVVPTLPKEEPVVLLAPVPFYRTKKFLVWLLIIIVVVLGAGYYAYTKDVFEPGVAEVNGIKITRSAFDEGVDIITKNAVAQGINLAEIDAEEIINQQALDVLILNTLIREASKNLGIKVTEEEIDEKYTELISVVESQLEPGETIASKLEEADISEEDLRETIGEQLLADKYIEAATDVENIQVSDEEVAEFYAAFSAVNPEAPALVEVRDQIVTQLKAEKQQQMVSDMLEKLRSEADIEINI